MRKSRSSQVVSSEPPVFVSLFFSRNCQVHDELGVLNLKRKGGKEQVHDDDDDVLDGVLICFEKD